MAQDHPLLERAGIFYVWLPVSGNRAQGQPVSPRRWTVRFAGVQGRAQNLRTRISRMTLLQKPLNAESAERAELKICKIGKKSCFYAQNPQKISAFFARSA
jgi:hypothetical protein